MTEAPLFHDKLETREVPSANFAMRTSDQIYEGKDLSLSHGLLTMTDVPMPPPMQRVARP